PSSTSARRAGPAPSKSPPDSGPGDPALGFTSSCSDISPAAPGTAPATPPRSSPGTVAANPRGRAPAQTPSTRTPSPAAAPASSAPAPEGTPARHRGPSDP